MTAVDLSSYAGLCAMVLLTVNILLGLMLSTRFDLPKRWWPYGRARIFDIHNWTAYIALGFVFLHPVLLLFSTSAGFKLLDIVLPIHSPGQTFYNCLGASAFYAVLFVVVTSYARRKIGYRVWRAFHYVAYGAATLFFVHGILIDPNLKQLPPDLLDGEKILVEVCCLLVIGGSAWRVRKALQPKSVQRQPAAMPAPEIEPYLDF